MGGAGEESGDGRADVHGAHGLELVPAGVERIDGDGRIAEGDGGVDEARPEASGDPGMPAVAVGVQAWREELPEREEQHDGAGAELERPGGRNEEDGKPCRRAWDCPQQEGRQALPAHVGEVWRSRCHGDHEDHEAGGRNE